MEKFELKINAWLNENLIPRLAAIFREKYNVADNDVECKVSRPKGSFYLSDLFFATIRFPNSEEKCLLIKLPPQNSFVRGRQNYDNLFLNEMLFYERVADGNSVYPLCHLCGDDSVFGKIIVLENVCPRGYFVCPVKTNAPFDYLIAGLQTLARFHGNTYTLKERNPTKFQQIVNDIIPVRYDLKLESCALYARYVNIRISRVTRGLQSRTSCDPIFVAEMTRLFEDCYTNVLLRSVKPREPLATIVHGDTTINNILFRKRGRGDDDDDDEEEVEDGSGRRYEGMLVDFALFMYSSPATDVSTFLHMSASRQDIKERFQELFKAYHDTLTECLKEQKIWDPQKYSYDAFLQDYKRAGIFGYVISTFFLPIMTEYAKDSSIIDNVDEAVERLNLTGGGEALTNQLVDTLLDVHEAGLLDYYVNNQTD